MCILIFKPFGYLFLFNIFNHCCLQCVHLDSLDLIVHLHVATIVREMEHVTMSLEFVTMGVLKDSMVVYAVKVNCIPQTNIIYLYPVGNVKAI